ncbi:hypothetical protein ACHWQZ_G003256 [Mnemiopsis leidyi]
MDLVEDLGDGVLLPELTKALTLKDIWYREDPKLTFHRYENIRVSLDALKAAGCQFINMDVAGDLVSGNEKLCLSFIKVLLNHFGGKTLDSQPSPGLLSVVNDLQTRLRSRSSESPAPEQPGHPDQEPGQAMSNLFQTRSTILPIQEQIAAIQSPPDWPKNRSRSEIPEAKSPTVRERSHSPEKQSEVFRGRSHSPEKQPEVFRGRSHTSEKQPEVFRGRSHTPEKQPKVFRGRSHTPEKQPEVFRGRSQTPEKKSETPNEVFSETANQNVVKSWSPVQTGNSYGSKMVTSPAIEVSTQRFQKNSELMESIKSARPALKSHIVKEQAEVKPIEVTKVVQTTRVVPDTVQPKSDGTETVSNDKDQDTLQETEQPDPSLSSDKKLEFFLGRGPPPAVVKSRAISQGTREGTPSVTSPRPKTPPSSPPADSRGNFNPVMSQLIRETRSRQAALENHTSTEMPYQARGRESFLGLGTPARVKMKPTNLVIPQFKQNVVNGLTEIISQVNKIVEDKCDRVNNLTTDWADGQIILIITDWFSPGILEAYKHDHSLVKIGVSLATLKQLLDVGTEITPMDMFNSRIEMNEFRRFLSRVLWKNRARHQKPFSRTSEILGKEKEMRNIGMISASLMRRNERKGMIPISQDFSSKDSYKKPFEPRKSPLSQQFVPKQMVQLRSTSPIPESVSSRSKTPVPDKVETFQVSESILKPLPIKKPEPTSKKISTGDSKVSQITVSTSVVEEALLSTIPPAKPPRPKFMSSSDVSSANVAAPLEDDCILSTIPKRHAGSGDKRNDKGSADSRFLASSFAGPFQKINPAGEPEPPVRTTSFGRGRQYSAPQKPQRGVSKLTSMPNPTSEPSPTSPAKIPESLSRSTPNHPATNQHPDPAVQVVSTHLESSKPVKVGDSGGRRRLDTHIVAEDEELTTEVEDPGCGSSGGEDNASIDSLEQSDIEYNKNVSKMIAGFIDNETEETVKDGDLLSSPKAKKKVRFQDKTEEFNTESVTKEEESSYQNEDLQKGVESGEEGCEKSQDRIDRVGKHLLQDLADYFSSNVVETESDEMEKTKENTTSTSLKLEDFLPASTHFKTDFDQIDVNAMVFKSLSKAGIRPEADNAVDDDEVKEEDEEVLSSQMIELAEKEAQPSYFDIMCRRPSRSSENATEDLCGSGRSMSIELKSKDDNSEQGDLGKDSEISFLTPVQF